MEHRRRGDAARVGARVSTLFRRASPGHWLVRSAGIRVDRDGTEEADQGAPGRPPGRLPLEGREDDAKEQTPGGQTLGDDLLVARGHSHGRPSAGHPPVTYPLLLFHNITRAGTDQSIYFSKENGSSDTDYLLISLFCLRLLGPRTG